MACGTPAQGGLQMLGGVVPVPQFQELIVDQDEVATTSVEDVVSCSLAVDSVMRATQICQISARKKM